MNLLATSSRYCTTISTLLVSICLSPLAFGTEVAIPDPNLESLIRDELGIDDRGLTEADLLQLESLANELDEDAPAEEKVMSLVGLEHAINLYQLYLVGHDIEDLSPLADLPILTHVNLARNAAPTIQGLEQLDSLAHLTLESAGIEDADFLSSLSDLTLVNLRDNRLVSLPDLSHLHELTHLLLSGNTITDVTGIHSLAKLDHLELSGNALTSLDPLIGLPSLTRLEIGNNPLVQIDRIADFIGLEILSLYPTEDFDLELIAGMTGLYYLSLSNGDIDDITLLAGLTKLESLYLGGNLIHNLEPLSGLSSLRVLSFGSNHVTDITPLHEMNTLEQVWLYNNYIDFSEGSPNQATFDHLVSQGVDFGNVLTQKTPAFHSSVSQAIFDFQAGAGLLTITADTYWTITCDAPWIEFDATSGFRNATISFAIEENASNEEREATVDIGTTEVVITQSGQIITIPDPNLEAQIRARLLKYDDPLTATDLASLNSLVYILGEDAAESEKITSLSGLEYATNLNTLQIARNDVRDLTPIAGLPQLASLRLWGNPSLDPTHLDSLTELTHLSIDSTGITDLSFVTALTKLQTLEIGDNGISDLPDLAALTGLRHLRLSNNAVSDLSGVHDLPALETLDVRWNEVISLDPLQNLPSLQTLWISDNPLNDIDKVAEFAGLVSVYADELANIDIAPLAGLENLKTLTLNDCALYDLSSLAELTSLENLQLRENLIRDLAPLSGMTLLSNLEFSKNHVADISPLAALSNLDLVSLHGNYIDFSEGSPSQIAHATLSAGGTSFGDTAQNHSTVYLSATPSPLPWEANEVELTIVANTYWTLHCDADWVTIDATSGFQNAVITVGIAENETGIDRSATFLAGSAELELTQKGDSIVTLADGALESAILSALGLTEGPVKTSQLLTLTNLDASGPDDADESEKIANLEGLEAAVNLTHLSLRYQNITDLAPLSGLDQLVHLDLEGNHSLNPEKLIELAELRWLSLKSTGVDDASFLSNLYQLVYLDLSDNGIQTLPELGHLGKLVELLIANNQIADLTALSHLAGLETLDLARNRVRDLRPLSDLTNLRELDFEGNHITDLTPLQHTAQLQKIGLGSNYLVFSEGSLNLDTYRLLLGKGVAFENDQTQKVADISGSLLPGKFDSVGGSGTLALSSDTYWTLTCDADWVTFEQTAGFQSSELLFFVAVNPVAGQRVATIQIGTTQFAVSQTADTGYFAHVAGLGFDPADPAYHPDRDLDGDGDSNYFEFKADLDLSVPWSAFDFDVIWEPDSSTGSLRVSKPLNGGNYRIEYSENFQDWLTLSPESEWSDERYRYLRLSNPGQSETALFYRAVVTQRE